MLDATQQKGLYLAGVHRSFMTLILSVPDTQIVLCGCVFARVICTHVNKYQYTVNISAKPRFVSVCGMTSVFSTIG